MGVSGWGIVESPDHFLEPLMGETVGCLLEGHIAPLL